MIRSLAIDQSTSATKVLLLDEDGSVLGREAITHRQLFPRPGWAEHDADEIWDNLLQATRKLIAGHGHPPISHLSISNQRETFVIFDRNGRPLHNAITWQCGRGLPICQKLASAAADVDLEGRSGLRLDSYFPSPKLVHLLEENPHLGRRLAEGSALFGTIDTYLIWRLTGGSVFATDSTNASRTLLFNIHRLAWDPVLTDLFQVPIRALAEVRDSSASFGMTRFEGLIPDPIPIRGVMGDSQASLLGHGCLGAGSAKVTFGTGSSLLLQTGRHPQPAHRGAVTSLAWVINGKPAYALEGIIHFSAATFTWLRDQLGLFRDVDEIEQLASSVPDSAGVTLVPAFSGLGAPHWCPQARGSLSGLSAHSTRAHVARAAHEAIALQVADALDMLTAQACLPLTALHADGGPTRNRLLMELTAALIGTPLRVNRHPDLSPLGAASAARFGLGLDPFPSLSPDAGSLFQPALPPETCASLRSSWNASLQSVLHKTRF